MDIAIYVHVPYCLQRCRYCDFTTFEHDQILPPELYFDALKNEIRSRARFFQDRQIASLYFGGGTPSLVQAELIVATIHELANAGFALTANSEVTIEINPKTMDQEKFATYQKAGINRFSVGAQTFNDALLKTCGRKHNADDTRETLTFLKKSGANYSFDLLFALPGQTLRDLEKDLSEVVKYAPPHLSAYCLTVPESHPMAQGRAPEDEQIAMFDLIEQNLNTIGVKKYEISNFAKPGFESRHNLRYWSDQSFWGLGVSAHSYDAKNNLRYWNPKNLDTYIRQAFEAPTGDFPLGFLPASQQEWLKPHEQMTDFCHMYLRTMAGLPIGALRKKFLDVSPILPRLEGLTRRGLLEYLNGAWRLTREGVLLSNQVFAELTFLSDDLKLTSPQPKPYSERVSNLNG